jgi:hypothetical protein
VGRSSLLDLQIAHPRCAAGQGLKWMNFECDE